MDKEYNNIYKAGRRKEKPAEEKKRTCCRSETEKHQHNTRNPANIYRSAWQAIKTRSETGPKQKTRQKTNKTRSKPDQAARQIRRKADGKNLQNPRQCIPDQTEPEPGFIPDHLYMIGAAGFTDQRRGIDAAIIPDQRQHATLGSWKPFFLFCARLDPGQGKTHNGKIFCFFVF